MQNTPKEWTRIDRIKSLVQRHSHQTVVPLGDDAFVFKNFRGLSVIAQDMMVEDVHFSLKYTAPAELGHKALAINLSDMAAMGARPHFAQVSLAIPRSLTESWLDEFYIGMTTLADKFQVEIVGGDLCASPSIVVSDVSVYGSCEEPLTRSGAQVGDLLLSSGPLGLSYTGLLALQNQLLERYPASIQQHKLPMPRMDLVEQLQQNKDKVHALMDCSDGFVNDTLVMSRRELGFDIFADSLPIHEETSQLAIQLNKKPLDLALWGGEDYQLLLAINPKDYSSFPEWHLLGEFNDKKDFYLLEGNSKNLISTFKGWRHF